MAAHYRAQLTQMSTSAGGSHRDLAEKYKVVLDSILQLGEDELVDGLKSFIDAIGKLTFQINIVLIDGNFLKNVFIKCIFHLLCVP